MNPFTKQTADSVAALGETALLRAIRQWLGRVSPPSPWGIGDDCAVLDTSEANPVLATTDGVVYGRHFDDSAAPAAVGAKLLKRNLSDIAAMGGKPGPALINLLLGRDVATGWLEQFYRGLAACCAQYGVSLVGGDMAQGPDSCFAAHLTLLGIPGRNTLKRTGAQVGDVIYVTGELGGSILGHHLDFTPRLAEGQWLARCPYARSAMDVTDGLAKDLPNLLPPGADALLDVAALPIAEAARVLASRHGRTPLVHALTDGEDYELIFAINGNSPLSTFEENWRKEFSTPLTRIGVVAPAKDATVNGDLQLRDSNSGATLLSKQEHGYEHWR